GPSQEHNRAERSYPSARRTPTSSHRPEVQPTSVLDGFFCAACTSNTPGSRKTRNGDRPSRTPATSPHTPGAQPKAAGTAVPRPARPDPSVDRGHGTKIGRAKV